MRLRIGELEILFTEEELFNKKLIGEKIEVKEDGKR